MIARFTRHAAFVALLSAGVVAATPASAPAQTASAEPAPTGAVPDAPPARTWVLLVVGLPGDAEHVELFAKTRDAWLDWFDRSLGVPAERRIVVSSLPSAEASPKAEANTEPEAQAEAEPADRSTTSAPPAGRAELEARCKELAGRIAPQDTLWLLTLGHGHYDGRKALLHLSGPDPDAEAFARAINALPARRQVVWLTHAASGWWVKPLARPGRIVIAATAADREENETEFPHALAEVLAAPRAAYDLDRNGRLSLNELFQATVRAVEARFKSDERLPTEHAQLDDDGDGVGAERESLYEPQPAAPPAANNSPATDSPPSEARPASPARDGRAAAQFDLLDLPAEEKPSTEESRSPERAPAGPDDSSP